MSREEGLITEDFNLWLKTKFTDVFWFEGHKFEKTKGEEILIDGAFFSKEEASELFRMLTSRNPLTRFNATILIWEQRGVLTKIIVALALIALILVYFRVRG